jgi:uncharacterized membrane protein
MPKKVQKKDQPKITVTLYVRADCPLCDEAKAELEALQKAVPHRLALIDVDSDPALKAAYGPHVPVVEAGPYRLDSPFTRQQLQMTLGAAADRRGQLERINDKAFQANTARGQEITRSDRVSYWISRHYLAFFNLFLVLYVGLPFMAPVFKKVNWNGPAEVIYRIYRPLCHQWAFRSFFLFGEQFYYPHAAAQMTGVLTFEQVSGINDLNDPSRTQARLFEGDPTLGYKVAFCERDVAIWGAMALFGLLYAATGRRLPRMHWIIWVLVGLAPIGLDGFSQLFSQLNLPALQSILPYRESTPFLRTLTGFLFGGTTAWLMFPLIEESMADSRRQLAKKFAALKP